MKKLMLVAAGSLCVAGGALAAGMDLVPDFDVKTGTITIKNLGTAQGAAGVVQIKCVRTFPAVTSGGGCPDLPPGNESYINPAFPQSAVVTLKGIRANGTLTHKLAFWDKLAWTTGKYTITVIADAGNTVAETNETNNAKDFVKSFPN
jgi:CARDB